MFACGQEVASVEHSRSPAADVAASLRFSPAGRDESMDADTVAVLQLLGSLPTGANPYTAIREYAWSRLAPPVSPSFEGQLIAIGVVFFLCLVFVVGSLAVRVWQRTFWVVHFGDRPRLWRPHFSVSWSMWAVLLLIFIEVVIASTIKYYRHDVIEHDFAAWRLFCWLPAWYGGFTAAWDITVSYLLHLHAYGHANLIERLAPWVNAAAIAIPTLYTLVFVPPAAIASYRYHQAMDTFAAINALLEVREKAYTGKFSVAELAAVGLPLLQSFAAEMRTFLDWFRVSFAIYAAFGFFLTFLLLTVATLYLRSLRRHLSVTSSWGAGPGTSQHAQQRVMRRTYANMAVTILAFSLLGLTFSGTSVAMAASPHSLTRSGPVKAFTLVPLYAFALLGLPTSILLFIRSFQHSADTSRQHSHVSISVNVVTFSEGPLPPPAAAKKHSVPYLSARRALALPILDGFELVAIPERDAHGSGDSCEGALEVYPSAQVCTSPHAAEKGPLPLDGYTFPPAPARPVPDAFAEAAEANRDSVYTLPDSLAAEHGSPTSARVYSFAYGATSQVSLPGTTPLTPGPRTPGAESMIDGKYWQG